MADLSINVQQDSFRVRDFVLGAAMGVALSVGVMEIVKVADNGAGLQAGLQPPPNLSVQVADEGCRPLDAVYGGVRFVQSQAARAAGLQESNVKIAEQLTAQRTLDSGLVQEVMRLDEFGQVDLYGLGAHLSITDGPVTAQLFSGIGPSAMQETLKLSDSVTAGLTPLFASGFNESLKVSDGGFAELSVEAETLRLADSISVSMSAGSSDLSATAGPETLKLADTPTTLLNPEESSPAESLKIADAVLGPTLDPEQAVPAQEWLKVQDTVLGPTLTPEQATATEALTLADTVTGVLLNPEQASPLESLKVQDSATTSIDPEQASPSDSLKIADVVTATIGAGGFAQESLKLADVVTATVTPEQTSGFDEALRVQDSVSAAITPLQTTALNESLKVQDSITVGTSLSANQSESAKVSDAVSAAITPEQASLADSLTLTDQVQAQLTVLQASAIDSLTVADSVTVYLVGGTTGARMTLHEATVTTMTLTDSRVIIMALSDAKVTAATITDVLLEY